MALNNFLELNLPYGMRKDLKTNKWTIFNRENIPLNVSVKYKGLTDNKIKDIVGNRIQYINNKIVKIHFYYDGNHPLYNDLNMQIYLNKLKKLSNYRIDDKNDILNKTREKYNDISISIFNSINNNDYRVFDHMSFIINVLKFIENNESENILNKIMEVINKIGIENLDMILNKIVEKDFIRSIKIKDILE